MVVLVLGLLDEGMAEVGMGIDPNNLDIGVLSESSMDTGGS